MIMFAEDLIKDAIYTFKELSNLPFVAIYRYDNGAVGCSLVARTRTNKKYYFYSVGDDDTRYYYMWSDCCFHEIDRAKVFPKERSVMSEMGG